MKTLSNTFGSFNRSATDRQTNRQRNEDWRDV